MLFSTASKASVCQLASLAPLPVLSSVLLNEDYFNSYLEHTQASTCLAAAERFTCFTMSQSAQYGEKKMIVLIAARSGLSAWLVHTGQDTSHATNRRPDGQQMRLLTATWWRGPCELEAKNSHLRPFPIGRGVGL